MLETFSAPPRNLSAPELSLADYLQIQVLSIFRHLLHKGWTKNKFNFLANNFSLLIPPEQVFSRL